MPVAPLSEQPLFPLPASPRLGNVRKNRRGKGANATSPCEALLQRSNVASPRQLQILKFIAAHLASVGRPPTYREIGNEVGIASTNGVNDHIKMLLKKRLIQKSRMKARGLILTESGLEEIGAARAMCRFCGQSLPGALTGALATLGGAALLAALYVTEAPAPNNVTPLHPKGDE